MSKFPGGMIGSVSNTPSGTAYTGKANGIWSLPHHIAAKSALQWAIGQSKPNPPTIGTATGAGVTSISVAFIPPVQNGGSTITSYTVTSSGGQTATGASSPIIVSGLTLGTAYTFTVTATNALGTSISSGTSNSAITVITDPYFSSVSLLLNGDTITDLSSSPKTITNNGPVTINTTTKKFGTGSMGFTTGASLVADSFYSIGTSDFTIELWAYLSSSPVDWACMITTRPASGVGGIWLGIAQGTGKPTLYTSSITDTSVMPLNTWQHIAVCRTGGTIKLYVNGVSAGSVGDSTNYSQTTAYIGRDNPYSGFNFPGYIDDLRVTVGTARYTANFTPPTAAHPTL
jgi:hypothetical protein